MDSTLTYPGTTRCNCYCLSSPTRIRHLVEQALLLVTQHVSRAPHSSKEIFRLHLAPAPGLSRWMGAGPPNVSGRAHPRPGAQSLALVSRTAWHGPGQPPSPSPGRHCDGQADRLSASAGAAGRTQNGATPGGPVRRCDPGSDSPLVAAPRSSGCLSRHRSACRLPSMRPVGRPPAAPPGPRLLALTAPA